MSWLGRFEERLGWRFAALKNGFQDATAYRIEFAFEILGAAAVPVAVQLVLWYALFTVGGATEIGGMKHADLIQYTLVSALFTQVRGGDLDFELQELIRNGQLSNYLVRPVSVIEFIYLRGSAPRFFVALLGLAIGCIAAPFFGLDPVRMILAMMLAVVGNLIHYQLSAALASTAFYWEEAYSVLMVKNLTVTFLSGELLPLSFFPESMQWLWKATPFYLYVFGPTQIATGQWSAAQIAQSVAVATAWIVIGWALTRLTWSVGMKRYISLGG